MKAILKSYIEGLRWSGIRTFLFDCAKATRVELTIDSEDKGWIRTTVYFHVRGDVENVERFQAAFTRSVAEFNKD